MEVRAMKDEHRMFLQGMMSRKILEYTDVKKLYESCLKQASQSDAAVVNLEDIVQFIGLINFNINTFHLTIVKCTNELTGRDSYALINQQDSAITRLASHYTNLEFELYYKLIKAVVESHEGCISSTSYLNLTDYLSKNMTKTSAQELLSRFDEDNWIVQKRGKIYLSTLAITELDPYIKKQFPDHITICKLCKGLVLTGETCTKCNLKLHSFCVKRYFGAGKRTCMKCKTAWPESSLMQRQTRASTSMKT